MSFIKKFLGVEEILFCLWRHCTYNIRVKKCVNRKAIRFCS
jgi:hypothetical protein